MVTSQDAEPGTPNLTDWLCFYAAQESGVPNVVHNEGPESV